MCALLRYVTAGEVLTQPAAHPDLSRGRDLPFTTCTAFCTAHATCTDNTDHRNDGITALGLSGEPVHEPVHAEAPASPHPATVRNIGEITRPMSARAGSMAIGADGFQTAAMRSLNCGYAAGG